MGFPHSHAPSPGWSVADWRAATGNLLRPGEGRTDHRAFCGYVRQLVRLSPDALPGGRRLPHDDVPVQGSASRAGEVSPKRRAVFATRGLSMARHRPRWIFSSPVRASSAPVDIASPSKRRRDVRMAQQVPASCRCSTRCSPPCATPASPTPIARPTGTSQRVGRTDVRRQATRRPLAPRVRRLAGGRSGVAKRNRKQNGAPSCVD
jgi:hypothetical protein